MQFDHLNTLDKVKEVSSLTSTGTLESVKKEISKCELVCANCHAERTYRRGYMHEKALLSEVELKNKNRPIKDQNGVVYQSQHEAARQLGLRQAKISMVLNGKRKHTGGFMFSFVTAILK